MLIYDVASIGVWVGRNGVWKGPMTGYGSVRVALESTAQNETSDYLTLLRPGACVADS